MRGRRTRWQRQAARPFMHSAVQRLRQASFQAGTWWGMEHTERWHASTHASWAGRGRGGGRGGGRGVQRGVGDSGAVGATQLCDHAAKPRRCCLAAPGPAAPAAGAAESWHACPPAREVPHTVMHELRVGSWGRAATGQAATWGPCPAVDTAATHQSSHMRPDLQAGPPALGAAPMRSLSCPAPRVRTFASFPSRRRRRSLVHTRSHTKPPSPGASSTPLRWGVVRTRMCGRSLASCSAGVPHAACLHAG